MLLQLTLFSNSTGPVPFTFSTLLEALLKILFVIGAMLYLVFAFVVVRQIHVMKSTVITPFSPVVQLLGFVHLVFAFSILLLFITTL